MRVKVYDEEYEIFHENSFGYEKVLKKIDPLLNKHARRLCKFGIEFEDAKQDVLIILIEGIRNYDLSKKVKLSTFLHVHINNKVISKIKTLNKKSRSATLDKNAGFSKEINFSSLGDFSHEEYMPVSSFTDFSYDSDLLELKDVFDRISDVFDKETSELVYLVSMMGHTIISASEILGINPWTASNKLKKVSKDKRIMQMLKEA